LLTLVADHIPHRRAKLFFFNHSVEVGRVELSHVSSGLVTQVPSVSPSYTLYGSAPSSTPCDVAEGEPASFMIEGCV
jgi:hypothetical protein